MISRFALRQKCLQYGLSLSARSMTTTKPWRRASGKRSQDLAHKTHETAENTRSGKDQDVAAMHDAAFNPNKTRPESEVAAAETEDGNPLAWSPANLDLSKPTGDESSAGTSAPAKPNKKVQSGGGNKTK